MKAIVWSGILQRSRTAGLLWPAPPRHGGLGPNTGTVNMAPCPLVWEEGFSVYFKFTQSFNDGDPLAGSRHVTPQTDKSFLPELLPAGKPESHLMVEWNS